MSDLPEWVKPTAFFWFNYPEGGKIPNPNHGRKFQVRAIVDDRAVIREWWRSKQRWHYTVEDAYYFEAYGRAIVLRAPVRETQQGGNR